MRSILAILCSLAVCIAQGKSRNIIGQVVDTSGAGFSNVMVRLFLDSNVKTTYTGLNGAFRFPSIKSPRFEIEVNFLGKKAFSANYEPDSNTSGDYIIKPIVLGYAPNNLNEVIVSASPMIVKEDTVQYNVASYKVKDGATIEEVIKKLPGIIVDKSGGINAQGQQVTKVKVNGKDFFGGDITTATRNLPASIVDNVQVIEDYGEQARLTGIKGGTSERILNINTKSKHKGSFGSASVAGGTNDRYFTGVTANYFNAEQQLSFLGTANNINTSNSKLSEDLSNNANGLNSTQTAGVNYRNKLSAKLLAYGSYTYTRKENTTNSFAEQQDINPVNTRYSTRNGSGTSQNITHRLQTNFEYTMSAKDYLKITPYLSTSSANMANNSIAKIRRTGFFTDNSGISEGKDVSQNGGVNLFFNHKFKKTARNLAFSIGVDQTQTTGQRNSRNSYLNIDSTDVDSLRPNPVASQLNQHQNITTLSKSFKTQFEVSYTEPVSKSAFLEIGYKHNKNNTSNNRDVTNFDTASNEMIPSPGQTNHYRYSFTVDKFSLNFKKISRKFNLVAGFGIQETNLSGAIEKTGISTDYRNLNVVPNIRLVYNFQRNNTLTLVYSGTNKDPGFEQLQPVVDSSNLTNILIGNQHLKTEFTNRVNLRYNRFSKTSENSIFLDLSANETRNKIVQSVANEINGTGRTTTYVNAPGAVSVVGIVGLTQPFANRKLVFSASVSSAYNTNISFVDDQRNDGNSLTFTPSARLQIDIPNRLDVQVNASYSFARTITEYQQNLIRTQSQSLSVAINGKAYFLKNYTVGYDYTKTFYYGYGDGVSINPDIINVFLEYSFVKTIPVKLRIQVNDLLDQNTGVSRSVYGSTITDSRTNRLGRFILLGLTLTLQQFKANKE
ncbi:TonB-dependent receptor [Pedobacter sp. KR3-3]|uniref:TonB-dependent receptor n=1 Tax=Pedobacter albus TaxID=3113905 RepID=A0ABU7IAM4_9SPHI|nr:TonB-dependent receptor [Pedobacter sp. KR3-3]MEE1946417.1 TonB-dependent receptor [Pedobacter sp. KR3-3]